MDIEIELFATLRQGRFRRKSLVVPPDSTLDDVCRHLGIGPQETAFATVNGTTVSRQHALKSGDSVGLFPALGGG
jgi:sulfur-carrier protein